MNYEPRRTFGSMTGATLSKCQYGGSAVHNTHYHSNGGGRDTYIVRDNGGFNKMYHPVNYPKGTSFNIQSGYRERVPAIHAKNLYYRSDGTGRD